MQLEDLLSNMSQRTLTTNVVLRSSKSPSTILQKLRSELLNLAIRKAGY